MLSVDGMEKKHLPECVSRENLARAPWTQAWCFLSGVAITEVTDLQHPSVSSVIREGQGARRHHLKLRLGRKQ